MVIQQRGLEIKNAFISFVVVIEKLLSKWDPSHYYYLTHINLLRLLRILLISNLHARSSRFLSKITTNKIPRSAALKNILCA